VTFGEHGVVFRVLDEDVGGEFQVVDWLSPETVEVFVGW